MSGIISDNVSRSSGLVKSAGGGSIKILEVNDEGTTNGVENTNVQLTGWGTASINDFGEAWSSTNGKLTVADAGKYFIRFHLDVNHGGNDQRRINAKIYLDDVETDLVAYHRFTVDDGVDRFHAIAAGVLDLSASDEITFYFYINDEGQDYTANSDGSRLTIMKVA